MKRFILILAILLVFSGCAGIGWQRTSISPEDLDTAGYRIRAFVALIGGATGALDKLNSASLNNMDCAIVISGSSAYLYTYDSASAEAESSPSIIMPDDAPTTGRWILVSMTSSGTENPPSNNPFIKFDELNGTDIWIGVDDVGNEIEIRTNETVGVGVLATVSEGGDVTAQDDLISTGDLLVGGGGGITDDLVVSGFAEVAETLEMGEYIHYNCQTEAYTASGDFTATQAIILLDGDDDGNAEILDLQDGTETGQVVRIVAAVDIDAVGPDSVTINMADTECTNCGAIVFDKIGENATLYWTGITWVVESLQDSL